MKKKAATRVGAAARDGDAAITPIRGYAQRKLAEMHGTKPNSEFDDVAAGFDAGIKAMQREASASRPDIKQPAPGPRGKAPKSAAEERHKSVLREAFGDTGIALSRMRSLGRLRTRKVDAAIEAYGELLATLRLRGDVLWFRANPIKLRLADETYYGPNFAVMVASGHLEMHHVMDAAKNEPLTTVKIAAEQFPFRFVVVHRDDSCGWKFEEC
ncbi:hypothetical protein [Burkholderia anthina]|uniref:hypothetical protein n=1 Tax=Burkholderia anthina TaxID=179879 RepID=UPI00158AB237|nr:hypothetical protein [Burkholderia anthina]